MDAEAHRFTQIRSSTLWMKGLLHSSFLSIHVYLRPSVVLF
jgi:hypothetical protein